MMLAGQNNRKGMIHLENNHTQLNQINEQAANATNLYSNAQFLEMVAKAEENKAKVTAHIGKQQFTPKVNVGQYFAVTTDAKFVQKVRTIFGLKDCVKLTFALIVPNQMEPVEIIMTYWESNTTTNPYYQQLSVLLGKDSREGFNLRDLIGKQCQVQIIHNSTDDGRIYANVDGITLISLPTNLTNSINF